MENKNIRSIITEILMLDDRIWNEDKSELNQILLFDLIDKIDETILDLLINREETRNVFFVKVKNVYVFKINEFKYFMEENKINNSFTKFINQIGLSDGQELLKNRNEIVIDFPFKDCILEGGQSIDEGLDTYFEYEEEKIRTVKGQKVKEVAGYKEKQTKRKEIFFNQIIAKDEIDRLLDDKAFVNWKRHTKDGEKEVNEIKRDEIGTIRENLIIKGNNLLALHSLKSQFANRIKLIYIDPPYNTGNDEFKYNDKFNHSTWLTFMKNRLEVAKELLTIDGSIFISIDHNEIAYLLVLLDEIFGIENRKNIITVKRSSVSGAKVINPGVVNVSEFLIIYSKNTNHWKPKKVFRAKERDTRYNNYILNYEENPEKWEYCSVLESFSEFKKIKKSQLKKVLKEDYEVELEKFFFENKERIIRFAGLDDKSISDGVRKLKAISKKDRNKTHIFKRDDYSDYYLNNGNAILFFKDRLVQIGDEWYFGEMVSDIWDDVLPNDIHNEGGVTLRKGKKPEKMLNRIIELTCSENDIVLDYHLGSGTTCAVSHKMNIQYIGIEQLDYGVNDSTERIKNVINGEQSGISKSVKWEGGGEFIYCELAKWNDKAKENIIICESLEELEKIFIDLCDKYFLNYNVKVNVFKNKVIKDEKFIALSLEEQKRIFLTMLDLNQMYVQKTEMEDSRYGIDKEEQKLTKSFYKE